MELWPGKPFPLGATASKAGTNFAVASDVAEGMVLCLFDEAGHEERLELLEEDGGIWHGFVPGVGPGQRYGYRVVGPSRLRAAYAATPTSCSWTRMPGP